MDNRHPHVEHDVFHDLDPTPRATNEPWRFTPSLLDPSSFSFHGFPNAAAAGYYTPTPGGNNTLFHPQAGDLPTPNLAAGAPLGTPLSIPTSVDIIQPGAGVVEMGGFRALEPHQMHHFNPFIQAQPPQQAFAPSSFIHQDTGYETMEQDNSPPVEGESSVEHIAMSSALHPQQGTVLQISHPLPASAEKFRFHSTLNAPTAMIKQADEIPVTYLNKGQAYSLTIADTNGAVPIIPGTKYRSFVRISFEDEQQRAKPGVCWSLWKEGRGTNEAHQRGGKLQAVEYVEAGQPAEGDDKRTRVELESSSFDGFCVVWTPGVNGAPEVNIAVRFNFLSTDFSHSKGVKGIPVRLCTKTKLLSADAVVPADTKPETCYCKVKLFRDHGAERKLSNDVAHVKKSIEKLKQQIAQAENGMKDFSKRKRSGGISKSGDPHRPGKVQKHKRTWSMSSTSSAGGGGIRMSLEEDLRFKLQTLQDMFTSTRPVSVLYLRGEDLDDPDLHPVSMNNEASPSNRLDLLREGPSWQPRSTHSSVTGSLVSPSPSSLSLASQASALGSGAQWQNFDSVAPGDVPRKRPDQPITVSKTEDDGTLSGWIEALGVDPSYRPPQERSPKPVACFYVLNAGKAESGKRDYHRAIYLSQRTLKDLNIKIAAKWGLDYTRILRTIRVLKGRLEIEMDDDMIQELREGQDMQLEIEEIVEQPSPTKREWEMSVDVAEDENDTPASSTSGLVLRLTF